MNENRGFEFFSQKTETRLWNSFHMKDMMVRELKSRLLTEMRIIAESNLSGAGWKYDAKDDYISIVFYRNIIH